VVYRRKDLKNSRNLDRVPREERLRAYRDVTLYWHSSLLPPLDTNCTPIAVEFRSNSEDLFDFEHPENPVYIFGPEDGSLGGEVLSKCHRFVKIDTLECLNLSTAAATIMYDRRLKDHLSKAL
jgi:tRNA(Leu) C34 or U34 (ribose-2'-O)-methylase TrmL